QNVRPASPIPRRAARRVIVPRRRPSFVASFVDARSGVGENPSGSTPMKYLTTLEVAHELKVSKQTLLNWLYAGKVPEPPRNKKGYRLWSPARISLVKKLIGD